MSQPPEWSLQPPEWALQPRRPRRPPVTFKQQPHEVTYYDCQQRSDMFIPCRELKAMILAAKEQARRQHKQKVKALRDAQTDQEKAIRLQVQAEAEKAKRQKRQAEQLKDAQRWAYWEMPPPTKKRKRNAP